MFYWFEGYWLYLLFSMPALLLGLWAQMKVKSAFKRYSRQPTASRMRGAEVARRILDLNGLHDVAVEESKGFLTDHYDPRSRTLRLSPKVYRSDSIAAAGIAAHEVGHAIQHKAEYAPLQLRGALVPTVQLGSWLGPVIFLVGFLFQSVFGTTLAWLGVLIFAMTAVFAVVTLPVEFDASARAKKLLVSQAILSPNEMSGVNAVLNAAALTYVAAAIQAITTVMYYAFLLMGSSRD